MLVLLSQTCWSLSQYRKLTDKQLIRVSGPDSLRNSLAASFWLRVLFSEQRISLLILLLGHLDLSSSLRGMQGSTMKGSLVLPRLRNIVYITLARRWTASVADRSPH